MAGITKRLMGYIDYKKGLKIEVDMGSNTGISSVLLLAIIIMIILLLLLLLLIKVIIQ